MPDSAPSARQPTRQEDSKSLLQSILQGVGFFLLAQFVIGQFFGNKGQNTGAGSSRSPAGIPSFDQRADARGWQNYSVIPQFVAPIWPADSTVDISIAISESAVTPSFNAIPDELFVLRERDFTFGNYKDHREISTSFQVPEYVQQNATLWAHFFVALSGYQLDPTSKNYDVTKAHHFYRPLTQYLPKKKQRRLKNLLEKANETEEAEEEHEPSGPQIASYYHPNFTISVIPDAGVQNYMNMHPALRKNIQLEASGARDSTGQNGWYYPIFYLNTFWQLRSHMTELNDTVKNLPLRLTLNNQKHWKYSILASMDEGMKQQARNAASGAPTPGAGDGSEFELFKEILLDTNSYLLATTGIVSILHMIFEGLAFKNDISHWRKKKDVVGTSVRTILANVIMQTIIFLYLMDNNENTSWMILAGQGFGILLEAWKITKSVNVRLRVPPPGSRFAFLPYYIVFEDKHKLSETEKKTQEYDQIAFKYLYIVAVPLLIGYAIYSLIYEPHKSWYSFIIETLVGSVYAYGFLMMVPSLYINYRLKSVAHMPGKAMTYKFLNTFIDDLFAFTIRMPTLHRLATLRDDVIFFIWLWQGYKYKVDYTRVNEFGQGGESEDEEDGGEKKKTEPASPPSNGPSIADATGRDKDVKAQKRR